MEIERKFLIRQVPEHLNAYTSVQIEQGYLNTSPVLRIRQKDDSYIFTYKSDGLMSREEIEVPLTKEAYLHLVPKCDGNLIAKKRYQIPEEHGYTIELDIFHGCFEGLLLAEIEFSSEEEALAFQAPDWLTCEVTQEETFHNSFMATASPEHILSVAKEKLIEKSRSV